MSESSSTKKTKRGPYRKRKHDECDTPNKVTFSEEENIKDQSNLAIFSDEDDDITLDQSSLLLSDEEVETDNSNALFSYDHMYDHPGSGIETLELNTIVTDLDEKLSEIESLSNYSDQPATYNGNDSDENDENIPLFPVVATEVSPNIGLEDTEVEKMRNIELTRSDPELDAIFDQMYEQAEDYEDDIGEGTDELDCELPIDDSNPEDDSQESQPLYPGATMTVGAFMLLLGLYFTKQNTTGDGIIQLLNILAIAFPNGNNICTSLKAFKKFFCKLKNPLIHHHYCGHCLGYIGEQAVNKCPYTVCGKPIEKNEKPYFLEISVENQIKNLFAQNGFTEKLQGRFEDRHQRGTFCDIYDGKLYKSYFDNEGPLSNLENISFTFNTDGAPVFKSSKVSVWPLFLVVNELSYQTRMKRENMILAGLWFGHQKPSMGTYLHPYLKTFTKMNDGIQCFSPDIGIFTCKGYLMCGTADLPARCLLCNGIQFNGSFACWKCKQKGETAKVGKGHTHVFPFVPDQPKGPERTKYSVMEDAQKALHNQDSGSKEYVVNGVKGPSWLLFFPKFDIVNGIAIDYMHGVLLGVQNLLLRLWFTPKFKCKHFSFYDKVCEVDRRLQNIKPTLDITRLPRSIENDLKYWKASEYRSFLLFFGAPVLLGILDENRFTHYLLLVNAMHILLKSGSVETDIQRAEIMLFDFCHNFATLYDKCYMTLNIHQLVHLADSVRCLGPLYTHSCFSFEDKNGFMLKMIRGTQNIDNQIITGISFVQKLPELKQKYIEKDSTLEKLYNSIEFPNLLKRGAVIESGVYVLGALKSRSLSKEEHAEICTYLGFAPLIDSYESFNRLELHNNIVYSLEYARMTKRDNSTVLYQSDDQMRFGRVRCFLIVKSESRSEVVAMLEVLHCPNFDEKCNILRVKRTNSLRFVPIKNIKESCMYVYVKTTPEAVYVCRFPNKLESD